MESLAETPWDVTISGTGLAQSLLALALSRSGKKILHVDKNTYYGGAEAAFSLQEAQDWAESLKQEPGREPFEDVSIHLPSSIQHNGKELAASRSYSLSLSPHIIYARSNLLPTLVSSRVYRQLEFQAVGSWWVYEHSAAEGELSIQSNGGPSGNLRRVPSSREDIFADDSVSMKGKRMLIKFLRSINQPPQDAETEPAVEEDLGVPFSGYLASRFNAPPELCAPLLSLSLSQQSQQNTSASFAVPRIKRHLNSMGVFGRGFGSVLPRWGGGAEIAQVGCRALAVGGGVYVLGRGVQSIDTRKDDNDFHRLTLSDGEIIRSRYVVGSFWDLPAESSGSRELLDIYTYPSANDPATQKAARSISIVSSSLEPLFPATAEGGPVPVGAVVVFPGQNLTTEIADAPPVYLLIHSSDTGECPDGQCVVYGSVSVAGSEGQALLEAAVDRLLETFTEAGNKPIVLWAMRFTQLGTSDCSGNATDIHKSAMSEQLFYFPPASLDLAFDDQVIERVRSGWKAVLGVDADDAAFMNFEDREQYDDD